MALAQTGFGTDQKNHGGPIRPPPVIGLKTLFVHIFACKSASISSADFHPQIFVCAFFRLYIFSVHFFVRTFFRLCIFSSEHFLVRYFFSFRHLFVQIVFRLDNSSSKQFFAVDIFSSTLFLLDIFFPCFSSAHFFRSWVFLVSCYHACPLKLIICFFYLPDFILSGWKKKKFRLQLPYFEWKQYEWFHWVRGCRI